MTTASDNASRNFAQKFNERLGISTGRRATPTTTQQITTSVDRMKDASRTGTTAKAKTKKLPAKKKETAKYIADAIAEKKKTTEELSGIHNDRPWWGDVLSVGTKVLDLASRPSFAVNEGLRNAMESVNAGEPVWSLGDDAWTGSIQGVMGRKKTGFGDVVEEATNYEGDQPRAVKQLMPFGSDELYGGNLMRNLEKGRPEQAKWAKRGLGLVGDIAGDPLTYVGGGLVAGVRGNVDNAARAISTEATKEATKGAVRKGVETALTKMDPLFHTKASSNSILTSIEDGIDEFGDKILRYVEAGPQRGKALYGREMPKTFASHAADAYRAPLVENLETSAETMLKGFEGTGKKLTRAEIAGARKNNPMLGKYLDHIDEQAKAALRVGQPVNYRAFHKKALETLTSEIDNVADDIYKSVLAEVGQATVKVPTIRVLGKDAIAFRRTGSALDNAARRMGGTEFGKLMKKSFSFADNFPGYTSLLAQKVKSRAYQSYEKFHADVDEVFRGLTKEQKKVIHRAASDGSVLDSTLEPYRQKLKSFYDSILDDEIESGLRSEKDAVRGKDYTYTYLKGGNKTERTAFKKGRKDAINKSRSVGSYTLENAKMKGLKPEEDAVRALLQRKKKSVRDMTRAWFQDDLVQHFGVASQPLKMDSEAARELVKIGKGHISKPMLGALKEGEEYYVPKVVQDVFDTFERMSTMASSEEAQQWLRTIDWVTRKFKAMATIPFPSYHIRNMMGDMYMGFMDGVRLKDYQRILGKEEGKLVKTISIGGETMDFSKIKGSFEKTASSAGYMATDITEGVGSTRNIFSRVRQASQAREDYGRLAHYTHALDEEYGKLARIKDKAKRFAMAEDAAIYRVNKYKFDYGALTPFETSVMKRAVPFYTYIRKAVPTLTESLFLNPKIYSYTNKLLQDTAGDSNGVADMLAPDWMREIGYTKLTGEDEPLTLRHDFLPTNAFQFMNPGAGDQTQGLAGNLLGMLNPLIQAPLELASGKDTFSGAPVDGPADILKNKIRPINEAMKWNKIREKPTAEKIFARASGIGLSRISKAQQENQFKNMEDSAQRAVDDFNKGIKEKGYRIRYYIDPDNNSIEYRIVKINADPNGRGKTVATASSLEEAKKEANKLAK